MTESLREIWRFRPLIGELVRRDLKLRYKNSVGGIAWSLLNPLMQILVITLVMKFIQARPIKDYSAYLFVLFLWNFISVTLSDGCVAILSNAQLVRKVYFPRAILPLATLLGNLFHFGVAFAFTILYFFMLGTYPSQIAPKILLVVPVLLFTSMFCLGCSFILSYLNVFYEDVRFIVTALLQLGFFTLPIFFTIEQVKAKGFYDAYMLNPIAAFIVTYQRALLLPPEVKVDGRVLPPVSIPWDYFAIACVTSVLVLGIGFALFNRYQWEMAERL
ncbi:MAG TPA: ABC transporter permease [Abditibacteriaceae bacterium]|jgi:ABC-type polysaccharide/polyol phosphate export permease